MSRMFILGLGLTLGIGLVAGATDGQPPPITITPGADGAPAQWFPGSTTPRQAEWGKKSKSRGKGNRRRKSKSKRTTDMRKAKTSSTPVAATTPVADPEEAGNNSGYVPNIQWGNSPDCVQIQSLIDYLAAYPSSSALEAQQMAVVYDNLVALRDATCGLETEVADAAAAAALYTGFTLDGDAASLASAMGVGEAIVIYQHHIDPDVTGTLREDLLISRIEQVVPAGFSGPIVLDWEPGFLPFLAQPGTPEFDHAVAEGVRALELARSLRPDAQWGFYCVPLRRYWGRSNPDWETMTTAIAPLIAASTALFPSVYDFYETPFHPNQSKGDQAYVIDNVDLALRHAQGKPVYPMVWHRYHDSNPRVGVDVIPDDEFVEHVIAAFVPEHDGHRPAGIVWWSSDYYARNVGTLHQRDQIPDGSTPADYLDDLNMHFLCLFERGIRGGDCEYDNPYLGPGSN